MTNLVKSLRKKGKYLEEDLIAYILYETLKVIRSFFLRNIFLLLVINPSTPRSD